MTFYIGLLYDLLYELEISKDLNSLNISKSRGADGLPQPFYGGRE